MAENPHYKELLQLLNEFEVEYLIVGGFAVMKYGEPRYTKDLDVWVHKRPWTASLRTQAAACASISEDCGHPLLSHPESLRLSHQIETKNTRRDHWNDVKRAM